MADNTGWQNEQERRQRQLLDCLRDGPPDDVPTHLLLRSQPGTRPFVGLVAHYCKSRQFYFGYCSVPQAFAAAAAIAAPVGVLFLRHPLGIASLVSGTAFGEVSTAMQWWLRELAAAGVLVTAPIALFLLGLYALGRLSWRKDFLTLDLNELHHATSDGLRHVPWSDIHAVYPGKPGWVRVQLEDGGALRMRVPQSDRDWLVQVIELLLRYHHRSLHGIMSTGIPVACGRAGAQGVEDGQQPPG